MKLINELSVKLGLTRKPTLADLLVEGSAAPTVAAGELATPFFNKVLQLARSQRDKKFLDVLSEVSGHVDTSELPAFPTPDCLTPEEVYDPSGLDKTRVQHAEQCAWCKTMLRAAQPTQLDFQELMTELRKRAHMTAGAV
jgi:hypothetical protein